MPMFHMMTALVIFSAIIDFATECDQSPKKRSDVAKVDRRVEILKLSLSKDTDRICICTHTNQLILHSSTKLVAVRKLKIFYPERA